MDKRRFVEVLAEEGITDPAIVDRLWLRRPHDDIDEEALRYAAAATAEEYKAESQRRNN